MCGNGLRVTYLCCLSTTVDDEDLWVSTKELNYSDIYLFIYMYVSMYAAQRQKDPSVKTLLFPVQILVNSGGSVERRNLTLQ